MGSSGQRFDEIDRAAAERLTYFTDAVAAIALTLLALELPVPEGASPSVLWHSVGDRFYEYLAFVISFVVIATHWSSHHDLFRWVIRVDNGLRRLNFCWLLTIIIVPFAAKLLSESGEPTGAGSTSTLPARFATYAAIQVLASVVFLCMLKRMAARRLVTSDTPSAVLTGLSRKTAVFGIKFGLSIPLFLVWDRAWWLWILPVALDGMWRRARPHGSPFG